MAANKGTEYIIYDNSNRLDSSFYLWPLHCNSLLTPHNHLIAWIFYYVKFGLVLWWVLIVVPDEYPRCFYFLPQAAGWRFTLHFTPSPHFIHYRTEKKITKQITDMCLTVPSWSTYLFNQKCTE